MAQTTSNTIINTQSNNRIVVREIIQYIIYAYCAYIMFDKYGWHLSMSRLFETYAPFALNNNLSLIDQINNRGGIFELLYDTFIDLVLLQIQTTMYKAYIIIIILLRICNFFIELF